MDSSSKPFEQRPAYIQVNAHSREKALMVFDGLYDGEAEISAESASDIIMPLAVLAKSINYQECWSDGATVESGVCERNPVLTWTKTNHHLMLCFQCGNQSLNELVISIYNEAYDLAQQHGFGHLIRVWNYLDQINNFNDGAERYQTFCVARHQALEELNQLNQPNPAATAIGGHLGYNTFVFLFSHQQGNVIENKRQVSAWQYPQQYAPKQPRFSRALQHGNVLLCSGTASVVGHETIHLNDLAAQFDECMINIQALLDESELDVCLDQGIYRFYLRDKTLVNQVVEKIQQCQIDSYVVLEGDVCRENLLIECEAVFHSTQKTVKLNR